MRNAAIVCVAMLLVACGSDTIIESGSSGGGGTSSGNPTPSGSGASAGSSLCPEDALPTEGSPCSVVDSASPFGVLAHCMYGNDIRYFCRDRAVCEMGSWTIERFPCNDGAFPCSGLMPVVGQPCELGRDCFDADGTHCFCSECEGGSPYPVCQTVDPPQWACTMPAVGCPPSVPNAGEPCSEEGQRCGPNCDVDVICEDGRWIWREGECPMCAAPTTPIATPSGDRPIASLRAGDLVFSVHDDAIVAVPIARVSDTRVSQHRVMRVQLQSGAVLEISPGHPTADGRTFADLARGTRLDGQLIQSAELVPFSHARTHDILPASETGTYFAAGALVGSSLSTPRTRTISER